MLVFVHLYVTLYLSQKIIPSCFFPLLVKCFTLRPLFDIYTLFLRINQGFIVTLSIAKHFRGREVITKNITNSFL